MAKQQFYHLEKYLDDAQALNLYLFLRDNVKWSEGIRSYKGHTRMAASYDINEFIREIDDYPLVTLAIKNVIEKYSKRKNCAGIYLNYYKDGDSWTPAHTHLGTTQIVISLGGTRTFTYGKKEIASKNGDVLVFGSTVHGVPKEKGVIHGRISIAIFMT